VREPETAKVDDKAMHALWVHTDDRDEPKVKVEYNLRTAAKPSRSQSTAGKQ